jgi:hypothetical protein
LPPKQPGSCNRLNQKAGDQRQTTSKQPRHTQGKTGEAKQAKSNQRKNLNDPTDSLAAAFHYFSILAILARSGLGNFKSEFQVYLS